MLQLDGYTFQPQPIQKTEICSTYNVSRLGTDYKAVIYHGNQIAKYSLQETLEYNRVALNSLSHTGTFLKLHESVQYERGEVHYFENYDMDLKTFIDQNPQKYQKVLEILKDAMRAIGDAYSLGFYPINLRPEHLVMAGNKWKIRSLVYAQSQHGNIKSCMVWDQSRQAPQAYEGTLEDEKLYNSLVWDLGSIILHMIKGTHFLNAYERIKQFCFKELLKTKLSVNPSVGNLLVKMLIFNPQNRMKLQQLFNQKSLIGDFTKAQRSILIMDRASRIQLRQKSMIASKSNIQKFITENNKFSTILEKVHSSVQKQPFNQLLMSSKIINLQMMSNLHVSTSQLKMTGLMVESGQIKQTQVMPSVELLPIETQQIIIRKYKDQIGKSDLCLFLADMAEEIAFKEKKAEWVELTKFMLLVQSVIRIHKHAYALNMGENCFKLPPDIFGRFMCTNAYSDLQTLFNRMTWESENRLQKSRELVKKINLQALKLQTIDEIKTIFCSTVQQIVRSGIQHVRAPFKDVLRYGYRCNLSQYQQTYNERIIKHTFLIIMIINIDKMYANLQENDRSAWQPFDTWRLQQNLSGPFNMQQVIRYVKTTQAEVLANHYNTIGKKYYGAR